MSLMMLSIMWNIFTSLLFLVAIHRGAVTAVVAETDGKQLTIFLLLIITSYKLLLCQLRRTG